MYAVAVLASLGLALVNATEANDNDKRNLRAIKHVSQMNVNVHRNMDTNMSHHSYKLDSISSSTRVLDHEDDEDSEDEPDEDESEDEDSEDEDSEDESEDEDSEDEDESEDSEDEDESGDEDESEDTGLFHEGVWIEDNGLFLSFDFFFELFQDNMGNIMQLVRMLTQFVSIDLPMLGAEGP